MKHNFAEKPFNKSFFCVLTLLSVIAIVLHACKKENSHFEKKQKTVLEPKSAKIITKIDENLSESKEDDRKAIYLTFDDGPNRGTENLIKILNKHQVSATSFVIGKHINDSQKQKKDFQKLEEDSLIEIANHSYNHANNKYAKYYSNAQAVVHDFKIVKDSLKINSLIARTPGRNIWRINSLNITDIKSSKKAADDLHMAGFKLVGWDLEWRANPNMKLGSNHQEMLKKVDSIFLNNLEKTPKNLVILTHDQYLDDENSVKELDNFIQKLQESNRFVFKKISDYPGINEILN